MVAIVGRYRDHVLWAGHHVPRPDADAAAIRAALAGKMKRNVSLGVIEALICLESAVEFCRVHRRMDGSATARAVAGSRQLYTCLAVLHDEHDRQRLTFLTGIDGYLSYPEVDYPDVLGGAIRVPSDKFVVVGPPAAPTVRFAVPPIRGVATDSPVGRCPAHRLRRPGDPHTSLNDVLWDLLVEVYRQAGRLD